MKIKIIFSYDSGLLKISDTLQYNEEIPCLVCLEKCSLGKPLIFSIGVAQDLVLNQLKSAKKDLNKFCFIDPINPDTFDDRVIGLIVKYYCAIIHEKKYPKWWNLRHMYGIDRYYIEFHLPYGGSYLERIGKQLQKVSSKKLISVVASSI